MTEDPEVPDEAASAAEIDLIEVDQVDLEAEETLALEKCTKQCAQIVGKNVKYHSNQVLVLMETLDQSIAEIATKTTRNSKNLKHF